MQRKRLLAPASMFALLCSPFVQLPVVSADEPVLQEQRSLGSRGVVVTATRTSESQATIGSSVSVITRDEIEAKHADSVLELLRSRPGVTVVQSGGPGRIASVLLRGAESDHTLVLIDGVRVNDNTSGQFDFGTLTTDNIERIEIVRGSQSVLYGSEALGGVINIITRTGTSEPRATGAAEGGSFGSQLYRASGSSKLGRLESSAGVSYRRTDGISAANSSRGNQEDDAYENFTFDTRQGLTVGEDGRADVTFRFTDSEAELDGFDFTGIPTDLRDFVQERDSLTAAVSLRKPVNEWLTPLVELAVSDDDTTGTDPETDFNNYVIDSQTLTVRTQLDAALGDDNTLTGGFQFEQREGVNRGSFDEERDVRSFYLQDQQAFGDELFLTAGIRFDNHAGFGEATTYRTTAAYLIPDIGSRLHGSFGTGFKAPSFNELFFPGFGNPDLDEEKSLSFDVGWEQNLFEEQVVVDATFFYSEFDDLIDFNTETFTAVNVKEAEAYGFETTLETELHPAVRTLLSYTFTESEDKATGALLSRRPRHQASLDLFLQPQERIEIVTTLLLVHSRRDSGGVRMDDYERVDLTASYELTPMFEPYLRIENLFDDDYEEIPGYGTPGFSVYGGLAFHL
ncbi:MAG: TonB-dependent receptor [Bdellovibrionales bacterium]|nr:TonB-dependent receptor [Bdellovibrionales bacterium]